MVETILKERKIKYGIIIMRGDGLMKEVTEDKIEGEREGQEKF
jgi:hypothetical protein